MNDKNKTRKAATLMEKQGFRDRDLYNKAHDRICTWLYDHVDVIHAEFIKEHEDARTKAVNSMAHECAANNVKMPELKPIIQHPAVTITKNPEYVINSGSYAVGFIDLVVFIKVKELTYRFQTEDNPIHTWCHFDEVETEHVWCYHVKSAYESMGALKREVNFYKEYLHSRHHSPPNYTEYKPERVVSHVVVGPRTDDIEKEMEQIDCEFIETPTDLLKEITNAKKTINVLF